MSTSPYGILATQPEQELEQAQAQQLPTIAAPAPAQGALQPIRAVQAAPLAPAPVFRPNQQRQQQEQALQANLMQQINRPKPQGFWPKAASILGNIGNAAGTIILGNDKMAGIPGTEQHRALQENATERQLGALQNQDAADQKAFGTEQDSAAKRALEGSQANEADARAAQANEPDLAKAYAHRVNQVNNEGGDPSTDPVAQHLADAITAIQKKPAAKTTSTKEGLQQKLVDAENSGDTATANKLKQQLKDLDPAAEQRMSFTVNQAGAKEAKAGDAQTEKEYTYTRGKWDKDLSTYSAQNEKLAEASQLIGNGALGDALGAIKSLSGLASGAGSGVRITQAELNSIAKARGLGGDFQAALQKFGDGRNLTPQQETQLKGILAGVQNVASIKEKVLNQGLDDLAQAKDAATIRKIDSQLRHALMGGQ